jgi:hypothetical protein
VPKTTAPTTNGKTREVLTDEGQLALARSEIGSAAKRVGELFRKAMMVETSIISAEKAQQVLVLLREAKLFLATPNGARQEATPTPKGGSPDA